MGRAVQGYLGLANATKPGKQSLKMQHESENDVLFFLITQDVFGDLVLGDILDGSVAGLCRRLLFPLCLLFLGIPLLLTRDLFQSVELFSVELVEFGVDVLDGVFGPGDNDVLATDWSVGGGGGGVLYKGGNGKMAAREVCTYMAFTRLLTTLMTSSKMTKAVCKLASSTSVSTALV